MTYKQALVVGLVLGLTCAAVVWYLERFEVSGLHDEIRSYLTNYDAWREWQRSQQQPPPSPPATEG